MGCMRHRWRTEGIPQVLGCLTSEPFCRDGDDAQVFLPSPAWSSPLERGLNAFCEEGLGPLLFGRSQPALSTLPVDRW